MSAFPKTCPHCEAGPDPDRGGSRWECGTEHRYHFRGSRCYEREADQLRARVRELEARVERLVEALASIREYWNRDANERAMENACWHAVNTAAEALDTKEAKPCPYCLKSSDDCDCSDIDVNPEGGAR